MAERKEIIRVLGFIQEYFDNYADEQETDKRKELFKDWSDTVLETIALLKAQEPHVLTLEEACGRDYCFYEYRAAGYIEPASVVMSGLLLNDSEPLVEVFRIGREGSAYVAMKDYGHEWRCWDTKPSKEDMEAEPWETEG